MLTEEGGNINGRWKRCGEGRWMAEEGRVTELIAFYVGLRGVGMGSQKEEATNGRPAREGSIEE